jgi:hypothetical protein
LENLKECGLFDDKIQAAIKSVELGGFSQVEVIDGATGKQSGSILELTKPSKSVSENQRNLQGAMQLLALKSAQILFYKMQNDELRANDLLQVMKVAMQYGFGNAGGVWDPNNDMEKAAKAFIDLSPEFKKMLGK